MYTACLFTWSFPRVPFCRYCTILWAPLIQMCHLDFLSVCSFHNIARRLNVPNVLALSRSVCVCCGSSLRWCGFRPGGLKGDAGGTVCHLLCNCIRTTSHHLLSQVQNPRVRTHAHSPTHMNPRPHTDVHKHAVAWRVEMKYPPHQRYSETSKTQAWRPWPYIWPHDPGIHMDSHTHTHKCLTHTYRCCSLYHCFCFFIPISKALLWLMCSKCDYLNNAALKTTYFPLSITTSFLASAPHG